jgi:hypothetical protein
MSDIIERDPDDEEPYVYHAPNGDPQEDDDEPEPDGRWCFSTDAGCWVYE